jgi:hypothetical protein
LKPILKKRESIEWWWWCDKRWETFQLRLHIASTKS